MGAVGNRKVKMNQGQSGSGFWALLAVILVPLLLALTLFLSGRKKDGD